MAEPVNKARLFTIDIVERATGYFAATSPDLPEFLALERTREELEADLQSAIGEFFAQRGHSVIVTPVEDEGRSESARPWVAVPVELISSMRTSARPL